MRYIIEVPFQTKLVFTVDSDNAEEAKTRAIAVAEEKTGKNALRLQAITLWQRKINYEDMSLDIDNSANKAIVDLVQIEPETVCSQIWEECKESWEKVYGYRTDLKAPDPGSDPSQLLGEQKALWALYHKKVEAYLASKPVDWRGSHRSR